jgi:predicted MFS family arabinose efflux permease
MHIDNSAAWWPRLLPLLAATIAVGTDAWVVAGFLPALAAEMRISTATAGLSVTVFAAAYALAAPILAALTSATRPRTVIAGALLVLAAANVVCAASSGFEAFLVGRVLAALAASVVTPAAGVLAGRVAGERHRGRALALVISGLTIATAVGVPIGSVLAAVVSWRAAVIGDAVLAAIAAPLIWMTAPNPPAGARQRIADRLAPLARPRVVAILALSALGMAAAYVPYAYVARLMPAGDGAILVGALAAYGVGAVAGSLGSGILTDRIGASRTLTLAYSVMVVSFAALAARLGPIAVILAMATWGGASWMQTPPQQHRLLAAVSANGPVAIGANASALYVGIAFGNGIGALLLFAGPTGVCLGAAAVAVLALAWNGALALTGSRQGVLP